MTNKCIHVGKFLDFLGNYTDSNALECEMIEKHMKLFIEYRERINKEKTLIKCKELQKKNKYSKHKRVTKQDSFNVYLNKELVKQFESVDFSEVTKYIATEHHQFTFAEFRNLFRNKIETRYRDVNLVKYHGIEIERIKAPK